MPVYGVLPVGSEFSPSLEIQLKTWVSQLPLSITESCGFIKSVTVSDTSGSAFPLGETTVTYTVTNNGDQFVESFFDVIVETDLTGSAGNDGPVCEGAALTLTAGGGGGGGGYTYDWTGPDDATYTGSPLVIPVATVAQHNGLWKVDITDIYDCTVTETTTVTVDVLQVAADFTADSLLPLKYSTVQLTDLSTGGATGWEWSFDRDSVEYVNGTTEHFQNPQVQFTDGGLYTVTLMVSNACSTDTAVKTGYIRVGRPGWWTGETSKNWHYSKNWDNHLVPDGGTDVIIPTIEPGCFNPKVPHNLVTNEDCSNLIFVGEAVLEIEGELIVNPGTEVIVKDSATIILITP
jgi:PKD repeat protein